jgi:hypothetical protein
MQQRRIEKLFTSERKKLFSSPKKLFCPVGSVVDNALAIVNNSCLQNKATLLNLFKAKLRVQSNGVCASVIL